MSDRERTVFTIRASGLWDIRAGEYLRVKRVRAYQLVADDWRTEMELEQTPSDTIRGTRRGEATLEPNERSTK